MELRRTYVKPVAGAAGPVSEVVSGTGGGGTGTGTAWPQPHGLVSDRHTVSGLTAGQVLKALSDVAFGFAALAWGEIASIPAVVTALGALANAAGWLHNNGTGTLTWSTPTAANVGAEPALGDPGVDGEALVSTAAGVRSWAAKEAALGNPGADGYVLASTAAGVRSWAAREPALGNPGADGYALVSTAAGVRSWAAREPALGNPGSDGYVLSSTAAGVRSWVAPGGSGSSAVQRLALSSSSFPAFASWVAWPITTALSVGDGHTIKIRVTFKRATTGTSLAILFSSDAWTTGFITSLNTDGNNVNYQYYSGSLHTGTYNNSAIQAGAHVLEISLAINSAANGGWCSYCTMQSKGAFNANMPPSLAGQTNVPLDGASFMIAVAAGALADIKALDVEVM